jgi:tetratricopeptide (TPR) repeat protein
MAERKSRQEIHIERNPIEAFLMGKRDYIRSNKKQVYTVISAVFISAIIAIAVFVYMDNYSVKHYAAYELIIENYRQNPLDETVKSKTIDDLKKLKENTYFGFVPKASSYVLGNIFFEDKNYEEAFNNLNYYVDKTSPDDALHPIALNKAAVSLEELGKNEEALSYLLKYADKTKDSIVMDQVLYNIGRLYIIAGDKLRAGEYFSRIIDTYPDSTFSGRARERLFLMSYKGK